MKIDNKILLNILTIQTKLINKINNYFYRPLYLYTHSLLLKILK